MKRLGTALAIGLLAFAWTGCSMYHRPFSQEGGPMAGDLDFVLQVDDYGTFWDRTVAENALNRVAVEAERTNTVVLVFVHGWHHNADKEDENLRDFAEMLQRTRKVLRDDGEGASGIYRNSRRVLTGDGDIAVIGIYIGWRGKALPMPLDYLTFWNRKAAAERVGQGDVREFLIRLNGIYRQRAKAREQSDREPFMGLVSFGHSFGGQLLFKAIAPYLEAELVERLAQEENGQRTGDVQGFGDIVVLINPAFEAYQYDRIHRLNSKLEYGPRQVPRLLVLSSEGDVARQIFFPLGRAVDAIFRPSFRAGQAELWGQALGEYEPQRTHMITIVGSGTEPWEFDPASYRTEPCRLIAFDLTNVPWIGGVRLAPTRMHKQYSPFIIAYADNDVVRKHSGIFREVLRKFMTDYVAMVQGKQMLLRSGMYDKCAKAARQ